MKISKYWTSLILLNRLADVHYDCMLQYIAVWNPEFEH